MTESALKLNLKAARVYAKMSQFEAAKRLGVSQSAISSWERGMTTPSVLQAFGLSDCYGLPINHIDFSKENQSAIDL